MMTSQFIQTLFQVSVSCVLCLSHIYSAGIKSGSQTRYKVPKLSYKSYLDYDKQFLSCMDRIRPKYIMIAKMARTSSRWSKGHQAFQVAANIWFRETPTLVLPDGGHLYFAALYFTGYWSVAVIYILRHQAFVAWELLVLAPPASASNRGKRAISGGRDRDQC